MVDTGRIKVERLKWPSPGLMRRPVVSRRGSHTGSRFAVLMKSIPTLDNDRPVAAAWLK